MNLIENIQLAIAGLMAGKMRALLTMLGIIIGIGSVIAIVATGNTLQASMAETLSGFGMNNIELGLTPARPMDTYWMNDSDMMTDEMIAGMRQEFGARIAAISMQDPVGNGELRDGRKYANCSVMGVNDGYKLGGNIDMASGRFITERDVAGVKNVAVISDFAAEKLFGGNDPLGQEIKLYWNGEIHVFYVVGTYQYEMRGSGGAGTAMEDTSTAVYIPIETGYYMQGWYPNGYSWFNVVAASGEDATALGDEMSAYMNRYYTNNENGWMVMAWVMEAMLEEINSVLDGVAVFIGAVAAISLLVGGIGVMNIMLVSVTERTREIGTRKALGARNSAIRIQFIVESMIICLVGGVIGILLGLGLGALGSSVVISMAGGMLVGADMANVGFVVPVNIIVIAAGFSMVIGVFFGFYPANKAAKLDPIEALRYE